MCETEGFIPRYYVDKPQDKVDKTLQDYQQYVHTLVSEESNLGNMIESSLKEIMKDKERESHIDVEDEDSEEEDEDAEIMDYNSPEQLTEDDFEEFSSMIEEGLESNKKEEEDEEDDGWHQQIL